MCPLIDIAKNVSSGELQKMFQSSSHRLFAHYLVLKDFKIRQGISEK